MFEKWESKEWPNSKVRKLLTAAAKLIDGHVLKEALIDRIVEPADDKPFEFMQLIDKYENHEAFELG